MSDLELCRDCGASGYLCARCEVYITQRVLERLQQHLEARCLTYTVDRSQPFFETTVIVGWVEPKP